MIILVWVGVSKQVYALNMYPVKGTRSDQHGVIRKPYPKRKPRPG